MEQINKAYLRSHGFDSEGNLYQAGSFDWGRHADVLVNATDAGYRPHWATCPQADRFKRGGRRRE